jgi:hypothetical protein
LAIAAIAKKTKAARFSGFLMPISSQNAQVANAARASVSKRSGASGAETWVSKSVMKAAAPRATAAILAFADTARLANMDAFMTLPPKLDAAAPSHSSSAPFRR